MNQKHLNIIVMCISILLLAMGLTSLVVAYQSDATILILDRALTRHVDQYLLERAVKSVIDSELNTLNFWAWTNGFTLSFSSVVLWIFGRQSKAS